MSIVASMDRKSIRAPDAQESTHTQATMPTWLYLLGTAILVVGFAVSEHGWTQSIHFAEIDEMMYDGTENVTADRLGGIDKLSTVTRISLAIFGLACFWYQKRFRLRKNSPLLWIGLAFGGMIYGSFFWSINPMHTLFKLIVLSCIGAAALGFATAFSLRQLLEWVAITCTIYIAIGILAEISLGTFQIGGGHRFVGTTHPNTEAIYGSIVCLSAQLFLRPGRSRTFAICIFSLAVICILLTKSRTTLAAVVVSFVVMQVLAARGNKRLLLILGCLFGAGLILVGSVLLHAQSAGKLGEIMAMGRTDDVSSLTGRLPLWEELLTWINKSPVLGYGYLAFWDAKRVEYLSETFSWEIPHGHNMYLDITIDVGIFGAILFVSMLICALVASARLYAKTGKVEYAIVAGIFICAMINGAGESLFKLPGLPLFVLISTFIALLHEPDGVRHVETDTNRQSTRRVLRK